MKKNEKGQLLTKSMIIEGRAIGLMSTIDTE